MYVNICTTVEKLFMYMCIAYRSMCVNARICKSIMYVCIYVCIVVFMCNGIFYRRYGYACPIHINAQTCILTYTYDHTDERTSPLLGLPKLKRNKEMQPVLFCKYVEKTCTYMRTVYKSMYDEILKKSIYVCFIYIQPCCSGKPRQLAPINT